MDNIALVAESGQGKSTIVLLLLRFYDTEFGEILVDGVNIKDYNL
jgi:ABC-type multidrug transport system fused ATPase/permease subunit